MNYIYEHIDKSQIGSGILRDYGIDFLNLDNFTGTAPNASNYLSLEHWHDVNFIKKKSVQIICIFICLKILSSKNTYHGNTEIDPETFLPLAFSPKLFAHHRHTMQKSKQFRP